MSLFDIKSNLAKRTIVAKLLGFVFGLIGFFLLPIFLNEPNMMFQLAILFWYATFGGFIGLFGFMDHHPAIPRWKFPFWFRGAFLGGWMNFVLVLFTYDKVQLILKNMGYTECSPFILIIEGIIIGIVIDYFATKAGGEGKELLK